MFSRLIALVVLCIPHAASPASAELNALFSWQWQEERDPISDRTLRKAIVVASNFRLNGSLEFAPVTVTLICANGKAALVFDWDKRVAGKKGLVVQYRFEGQPGRRISARYIRRSRQASTAIADIRQFLADASLSARLYVRAVSDDYGGVEARFHARDGKALAAKFGRFCPDAVAR